MKKFLTFTLLILADYFVSSSQSNPIPLIPDVTISQLLTVHGGVTRLAFNKTDSSLYYSGYNGNIYKVIIPGAGSAYDTLMYTGADHGIHVVQGMEFFDSTLYVSGNRDPDSAFTIGVISGGKLQPNGIRNWITVAETNPYETAGAFDHLFSGMKVNQTGDTILICNGSRGDHGEIQTRNGLFPGLRNIALTSVILQIPSSSVNLVIPDDSASMDAMGVVFARGIRNTYDFAYNTAGDLFGAENSGDRDMEDELNWLRQGNHYGFPWMMGSTYNPQQFAGYDTATDLLINHNSQAWIKGTCYEDLTFPQIHPGLQLVLPCKNNGPDAAFLRDSITGNTYNAAAMAQPVYSFTPHRSPLGLTFDQDSILGSNLRGNGFLLSFTRGNALLNDSSPLLVPFQDNSEDLLLMEMQKDTVTANYSFSTTKIVEGFSNPIDAVLMDTLMYVIEYGYNGTQSIWVIHFPRYNSASNNIVETKNDNAILVYPVPGDKTINFHFKNSSLKHSIELKIYNQYGQLVSLNEKVNSNEIFSLNTESFLPGIYSYYFSKIGKSTSNGHFVVIH